MSAVELIVFCVLVGPMVAAMIWALVKETKANCLMRRKAAGLAEAQTAFYLVANCIIREKYRKIMIEKEKNNESRI